MPRTNRKLSESGFHHIVTKGDGGQILFENERNRTRYLKILKQAQEDTATEIHAYCLMGNHVHLLARDRTGTLSEFMKQLNERYAMYFGHETNRIGHVFQDRFWSEPIEKEEYFLAAMRYIHANPEPAGICKSADYPWSSYGAYLGLPSFVVTGFALSLLGGTDAFVAFSDSGGRFAAPFPGSKLKRHLSVDELTHVAIEVLGSETLNNLRTLIPQERAWFLRSLKDAGFTVREISRVTGLGTTSVEYALGLID